MWNEIIGSINEEMPQFNDYMLTRYRKEDIAKAQERVDLIFEEAMKYLNLQMSKYEGFKPIKFIGSNILSPEQRIELLFKDKASKKKSKKQTGTYNIMKSEVVTAEYITEFDGQIKKTHINLPYLVHGNIVINNIKNCVLLGIVERVIYRNRDGIVIKVMQRPMHFNRSKKEKHVIRTIDGMSFFDSMVIAKIHYNSSKAEEDSRKTKRKLKMPLILYFLAEFGLVNTLNRFNISPEDVFLTEGECSNEEFYTFKVGETIHLQVRKPVMNNVVHRRIISSLHYLLVTFDFYSLDEVYKEDGDIFKIMLGKIVFGYDYKATLAHPQAVTHLKGVRNYLDPITKLELAEQAIFCNDIWDLFTVLFINFDDWLTNHAPNDLYEAKLDAMADITNGINNMVFNQCYKAVKDQKPMDENKLAHFLKMPMSAVSSIHQHSLVKSLQFYNDNELISCMGKKLRQAANQKNTNTKSKSPMNNIENFFHTSFPVVESLFAISNSNPCVAGSINPFAPIVLGKGYFIRPDYAKDIDGLERYLPKR